MAPKPFRIVTPLPAPLTIEETAEKFGVSTAMVRRVAGIVRGDDGPRRFSKKAAAKGSRKPAATARTR